MIRRVLLASSAVLALSWGAHAADLAGSYVPPPAFTWTGFYVGAHVGALSQVGNLSLSPVTDEDPPDYALNPHFGTTNFVGGALVGYNYQMGATVLGLEGDVGFTNGKSTVNSAKASVPLDVWYAANNLSEDINGHVRARLGWTIGRLMMFAAGGVALTDAKLNVVGYCPPDTYYGKASQTLVGVSLGAGLEYALTDHILVRAEYLFDGYGKKTFSVPPAGEWQDRELGSYDNHTVRLAISYKF